MLNEDFPIFDNTQERLLDNLITLEAVNYKIADLKRRKEELEEKIYQSIGHDSYGQRTYVVECYAVQITTGIDYKLNVDEWQLLRGHIPECFNPVKEKISYYIDKKVIKQLYAYGSADDIKQYDLYMKEKDKKLNVVLKPAI